MIKTKRLKTDLGETYQVILRGILVIALHFWNKHYIEWGNWCLKNNPPWTYNIGKALHTPLLSLFVMWNFSREN